METMTRMIPMEKRLRPTASLDDAVIDIEATAGMLHKRGIIANAFGCRDKDSMDSLRRHVRMMQQSIATYLKALGEQP